MANYEELPITPKYYNIKFFEEQINTPSDFSSSAYVIKGMLKKLPTANDAEVEEFLKEGCDDSLVDSVELESLKLSHEGWPQDTVLAIGGFVNFGAEDIHKAKAWGQRALRLNPNCTMARQLVKFLAPPDEAPAPSYKPVVHKKWENDMKDKGGYSYDDAVKVNGVPEEYAIVEATDCDQCNGAGYEKNQGSDPHSRFAQGAFFDVIHCECKFCHHRRDFVFDITGLPKFQMMIQLARASSDDPDVLQQVGTHYNEKFRKGLSTELKPAALPPDPPKENPSSYHYLPMIFALSHLQVRFNRSGDIAHEACLVQGTRDIPAASDEQIDAWWKSNQHPGGTIPQDIELQLLTAACSGWPEEALVAFAGISSFGAGDLKRAGACARHAIQQNPQCTLARQLVKLLTAKGDPRKPFGVEVKDAPDVVQMLSE